MIWRVRSRRTFGELRARGLRVRSGPVRLTFLPVPSARPQLAFSIGRRFGSAVERNRARRRLTEAFRVAWPRSSAPSGAYLLSADRAVLTTGFDALVGRVEQCLRDVARRHGPETPAPLAPLANGSDSARSGGSV